MQLLVKIMGTACAHQIAEFGCSSLRYKFVSSEHLITADIKTAKVIKLFFLLVYLDNCIAKRSYQGFIFQASEELLVETQHVTFILGCSTWWRGVKIFVFGDSPAKFVRGVIRKRQ